jgi:hypothetical protein
MAPKSFPASKSKMQIGGEKEDNILMNWPKQNRFCGKIFNAEEFYSFFTKKLSSST